MKYNVLIFTLILSITAAQAAITGEGTSQSQQNCFFGICAPLNIGFNDYPNLKESGTYYSWTFDTSSSWGPTGMGSCSSPKYGNDYAKAGTGYVIIPWTYYQSHKSAIDSGISSLSRRSGFSIGSYSPSTPIESIISSNIPTGSYSAKESTAWNPINTCESLALNIKADGSGLDKYFVIGVGCVWRPSDVWTAHSEQTLCDVATAESIIYDCDYCGGEICLLNYLNHNSQAIDGFYNAYGSNICVKRGGEHGFCSTAADCAGLASMPSKNLGDADHSKPYYALTAARCELTSPGDDRIKYVASMATGGAAGSCEYGAKIPADCQTIFGSPSEYSLETLDGGYNSERSGWAVDNGKCVLGECSGFAACYDLYNTVYYECQSVAVYTSGLKTTWGKCVQKQWTTAQIAALCDQANGAPASGKAWYVDQSGKCYQDVPATSECSKPQDCSCPAQYTAVCQQIQSASGNLGKCSCQYSGPIITPSECGDHVCDSARGETAANCAVDCGTPTTTLWVPPFTTCDGLSLFGFCLGLDAVIGILVVGIIGVIGIFVAIVLFKKRKRK